MSSVINFHFIDVQTAKEEITLTDSDSSDDDVIVVSSIKRSLSVIEEITLDSDDGSLINNECGFDSKQLPDNGENASKDSTQQSTNTMRLSTDAKIEPIDTTSQPTNTTVQSQDTKVQPQDTTVQPMVKFPNFFDKKDNPLLFLREFSKVEVSNYEQKTKAKRIFSTKNLYAYYCERCDRIIKKVIGKVRTNCFVCNSSLGYRCLNCQREYRSYVGIYLHLKENYCMRQKKKVEKKSSNNSDSPLPKCSSCSKHLESTSTSSNDESIPSVAADQKEATASCSESKSESTDNEQMCEKCGETVANGSQPCDGEQLFQCIVCAFRSCHKSTLMHHIREHISTVHSSVDATVTDNVN